jgi:hypothetical protein
MGDILGQGKTIIQGTHAMQIKTEAGKAHEIKNTSIAFGVYGNGEKRLGDVAVTSKGLVFSKSKSAKDVSVKWDDFINWMQSQLRPAAKTVKAKAPASKAKTAKKTRAKAAGAKTAAAKSSPAKKAISKSNGKPVARKAPAKPASKAKSVSRTAH